MIEFSVLPCNAKHTEVDPQGVFSVSEECEKDPEKQKEYLGHMPHL